MRHRFFVEDRDISGGEIVLAGENAVHAAVLRLSIGEEIVVCDGCAMDYHCAVTATGKAETRARILRKSANVAEPRVAITLYQALPKTGKMDEIIEKCTQLGVSRIVPVMAARCVAKKTARTEDKAARWQKIALAAASQSQRGRIPKIAKITAFDDALAEAAAHGAAFACYEGEHKVSLRAYLRKLSRDLTRIAFFIGPEGGFTNQEAASFAKSNVVMVSLGARILRTELAGAAALANILYEFEEKL